MADSEVKHQNETIEDHEKSNLKYMEFVQVAAIHAVVFFSSIYNYAKENSGPLKPGVQTVEGTVKTVIGPVYNKFHDVPFQLLKFADQKVDRLVEEVEKHVPSFVKEVWSQAAWAAHKAPEVARSITGEVQRVGVMETVVEVARAAYAKAEPTAKEVYKRYEPVAERYAVSAWRGLNRLPLFPEVAHIVVPTAAYWAEKYNSGVHYMEANGNGVAAYLPLIPTERIAKVFGAKESKERGPPAESVAAAASASASADQ